MKIILESFTKPDIAQESQPEHLTHLDKVGMANVELPVLLRDTNGEINKIPALCDLSVSLDDPHSKGIHMSRLYLSAKNLLESEELNFHTLTKLLLLLLESHSSLSHSAFVKVSFDYMIERNALISDKSGWRFYPISLAASLNKNSASANNSSLETSLRISYSSVCPCSAALARQLLQEKFLSTFYSKKNLNIEEIGNWLGKEENQVAAPHGQRSHADIIVRFTDLDDVIEIRELIDTAEKSIATVVQAAVKREDEQEFAKLNGENLLFSEDAARYLKAALENDSRISDYKIHVRHLESLHPHDAVVITTKNIPGGLTP